MVTIENILSRLPYSAPFRFVGELTHLDLDSVKGTFYLDPDLGFYKGHFPERPVTPGVILIEIMAQIGLVCLGLYLTETEPQHAFPFALSSTEVDFIRPVFPGETVTVHSEKIYFRFGKLKCKVQMHNEQGKPICEGTLSGVLMKQHHD